MRTIEKGKPVLDSWSWDAGVGAGSSVLAGWIVQASGVKTRHWLLCLCDVRGSRDKAYDQAEYEVLFMRIKPGTPVTGQTLKLQPHDQSPLTLRLQFHSVPVDDAKAVLDICKTTIVAGGALPEPIFAPMWRRHIAAMVMPCKESIQ